MSLLGIDVGTSGCKAAVIGNDGTVLASSAVSYSPIVMGSQVELSPAVVWNSAKRAIANAAVPGIIAISVASLGETVIPLDKGGNALADAILYSDPRGTEETVFLEGQLSFDKIVSVTGLAPNPMYSAGKILWLKRNRPEIYQKTWKFLLFADYILFRLGAEPHTDYTLAARTMAFDIFQKRWSSEILYAAGIDGGKFTEPVCSGTVVGKISQSVAAELGLPADTLLVAGGHDQACAALGTGVLEAGTAADTAGTTECVTMVCNPAAAREMAPDNYACAPHVVEGKYVTYAFNLSCGSLLAWYAEQYGKLFETETDAQRRDIYEVLLSYSEGEPSDVFVLPHFSGSGTPSVNNQARGAIAGLSLNTTPKVILKGLLDGLNYEILFNIEKLEQYQIKADCFRVAGGLAKSEAFLRLKADVLGKPVTAMPSSEAGILGAAMLAGTAAGTYPSLEAAAEALLQTGKTFAPDMGKHALYAERFRKYKRLYGAALSAKESGMP